VTARRQRFLVAAAALVIAVARWLGRARVPDDWDSVGFVRAVERFDLAAFQPHVPGYPVYVVLTRAAHAAGLSPLDAATAISALASAATAVALFGLASSVAGLAGLAGWRAGFAAMALWGAAWLPQLLGGAALSDATATALAVAGFAALTIDGPRAALLGAVAMALCLGTRLSYWPLALSFAVVVARWRPQHRRAAAVGGVVATAAWLLPFVALVGARRLWTLGTTHAVGHFADWGGSVATRPDLAARAVAFARGLVYDGLFAHWLALAVASLAVVIAAAAAARRSRARGPSARFRAVAAVVIVPYAMWVFFAQNVIEQPRHLLPLVAAAVVALALRAARQTIGAVAAVALVVAAAAATAPLAVARVRVAPAAVQLGRHLAAAHPRANEAIVFGTRSVRLIQLAAPSLAALERQSVGEVRGALERLDVLPRNLYVTSELTVDPDHAAHVTPGPEFCRDPRLDRSRPCLRLLRYNLQP
jgi:hypothetical protein